nr:hypothetical protein [uncultured Draconibacterium sp.]
MKKIILLMMLLGIFNSINAQYIARYRDGMYDGKYIHGVNNSGTSAQSGDPSYQELPPSISEGVYCWWNYASSVGEPSDSFGAAIGFGKGTSGTAEIWAGWTNGRLFTRFLRDCCQGWSEWNQIWTANTDGANSGLDADLVDGLQPVLIQSSGNVGIGTADPKNRLSVNGTIWAKEVKVTLADAADWVFDDDYELKSLDEVENFINDNKHLPDVPSAEEFREKDMNLAEMNNVLLQKVEELTLYLIKQNKLSKTQQEKIELLEKKVSSLEKK